MVSQMIKLSFNPCKTILKNGLPVVCGPIPLTLLETIKDVLKVRNLGSYASKLIQDQLVLDQVYY